MKNGMRQMIGLFVALVAVGCDAPTATTALEPEDRGRREREALAEQTMNDQQRLVRQLQTQVAELTQNARSDSERLNNLEEARRQLETDRNEAELRIRALHSYAIRAQCDGFVAAQTTCRQGQWLNEACSRRHVVPRACLRIGANYPRFPIWAYTNWEPVPGYNLPVR